MDSNPLKNSIEGTEQTLSHFERYSWIIILNWEQKNAQSVPSHLSHFMLETSANEEIRCLPEKPEKIQRSSMFPALTQIINLQKLPTGTGP